MDWIKDGETYTATITFSSVGKSDRVCLEGVTLSPDIPDEAIDAGQIPWSYKLTSFLLANLKQEAVEVDDELLDILGDTTVH